jgi:hypothetical protein
MNIISVDLGGTNTRVACTANIEKPTFTIAPVRRVNTHNYNDDLAFIIDSGKQLSNGKPIDALGIGVPGRINDSKTDMVASHNLPEWINRNFCSDLSKALNCPVYMDNDAVAASLGEGYFGKLKGTFHYLIWGTGISAVSVKYAGSNEIVATYLRPDYQKLFDAWENDCGGAGILRIYGKAGEQLTKAEWDEVNTLFADYLRRYITETQPSAVVFGGGLAIHHAETITSHTGEVGIVIKITHFGENSGLVGGLGLIRRGIVSAATTE